tara:strand:- start:105 stop:308 length:204 start_codon:yes stop_codon:yes gene_type:complete
MIKFITFIAFLYLLIELLSRTEQGMDGKVRIKDLPRWLRLINEVFNPAAKSSVVEVEVKSIDDDDNA